VADENSTQGMSQFVTMLDTLRSQWGCTVLIVHHTGKDRSKGARGNSALLGALDASFMVEMDEEKRITLSNQKMKDGETPENQFFALVSQRVVLPNGRELVQDDGVSPVTSCYLAPTEPPVEKESKSKAVFGEKEQAAVSAFDELFSQALDEVEKLGLGLEHLKVPLSVWGDLCKSEKYGLSRYNVSDIKNNKRGLYQTFHSLILVDGNYLLRKE
ncbi:MAG: AAA family ATPase, partial [bacterium]